MLAPDVWTDEQRDYVDAILGGRPQEAKFLVNEDGTLRGPFNALLRRPQVGHALRELGGTVRTDGVLPDAAREAVIMAVAAHWTSEFEWWGHSRLGMAAGITKPQVDAIRTGAPVQLDDPAADVALATARALLTDGDLDDDGYAAVIEGLGEEGLVELTALLGFYALLSMQMRVFRVPGYPDARRVFDEA
jgi:4-carboxymuconolactone decarboxylase